MITVSDNAKKCIESDTRTFQARLLLGDTPITGDIRSLSVNKGSCGESDFVPGSVYSSYIDVTIDGCNQKLEGKELKCQIGTVVGETVEWTTVGLFTVDKPSTSAYSSTFSGLGRISSKMGGIYSPSISFPAQVKSVLSEISSRTGVKIDTGNLDTSIVIETKPSGYMYREMIAFIAGLYFGYATEAADGSVIIRQYSKTTTLSTNGDRTTSLPTFQDLDAVVTGIKVVVGSETDSEGSSQDKYFSKGTVNVAVSNPFMTQAIFDKYVDSLIGYQYRPATATVTMGDFRLEATDTLKITDVNGTEYIVPCMSVVHTFDGGIQTTITAPAIKNTGEDAQSFRGSLGQAVSVMQAQLLIVEKIAANSLTVDKADIRYAAIKDLEASNGKIEKLEADNVNINEKLTANTADIENLIANDVKIAGALEVADASIKKLDTKKLSAADAELKYATVSNLNVTNANIETLNTDYGNFKSATVENLQALSGNIQNLDTKKLNAEDAKLTYANIDFSNIGKAAMEYFYAQSGLIKDVTVGDQTITGELVGVTIRGDRLVADSVQADKLVIKGEDGLYYKLNVNALGETTAKSDSKYQNGLDGSALIAKSVTAEKVSVKDLVAFGATIGGVNIGDSSIYSGVKTSVLNTTRGFYLGKDGQAAFGDTNNYLKYFQDTDGTWKLAISADSISIKSGANLGDVVDQIQDDVSGLKESGGFNWNLLKNGNFSKGMENWIRMNNTDSINITTDGWCEITIGEQWSGFKQFFTPEDNTVYTLSYEAYLVNTEANTANLESDFGAPDQFVTITKTPTKHVNQLAKNTVYGYINFQLNCSEIGKKWRIRNIKLEKGSVATAWTPAESEIYGQTGTAGSKMAVAQLTYTGGYWAEYNEDGITAAINNGLNGVNSTGNWSCSNASDFEIGDIAMCLCRAKDTGRYTYLLLKINNVTDTTIAGPAIGQTSGKNGETGGKGDKGEPGSDGKSLITLITNYSYAQSAIDTYAKYGYSGGWTVINSAGVNVGDTVLIRVTNTTKNGYSFIIGRVTAVNSATLVTCTSMGLLDKGDTGAIGKPGIDFSQGKMLYTDPTFNNGVNGISVYDNRGSGYVTISRTTKTNDNPIPEATYNLVISNTGTASPSLGGFYFGTQTRCNAIFVYRFIAWIPSGYTVNFSSNSAGGEYAGEWLTSNVGDGNYREYVYRIQCGRNGSYSTTGFFYLDGTAGTSSNPVKWWLAYATCYDMTATSDVLTLNTSLNQTKEEIKTLATSKSVSDLAGRVSTAESTITQHAKDISMRVTTETFNNLQIGGRNLLLRTADFSPKKWYQNAAITKDGNEYYAAIKDTWNGYIGQLVSLENTEYTVSFYAKTSDGKQYGLEMKDDSGNNLGYFTVPINSSEWKRYEHSFTPTKFAYTPKLCFLTRQSTGIIYLKQIKLEKGNKATDWTPAPEDQINVGDVTSQLNSELKITGNTIDFTTGHFTVNSTNLTISSDGTLTANNGVFRGRIEATSGYFGQWNGDDGDTLSSNYWLSAADGVIGMYAHYQRATSKLTCSAGAAHMEGIAAALTGSVTCSEGSVIIHADNELTLNGTSWAEFVSRQGSFDWSSFNTANTTDTWIPVMSNNTVNHRVLPTDVAATAESGCFKRRNKIVTVNCWGEYSTSVLFQLASDWRPKSKNGVFSGFCYNESNSGWYPVVGQFDTSGVPTCYAIATLGNKDNYPIYNGSTDKRGKFKLYITGSWITA